jgi:hypothetical protein
LVVCNFTYTIDESACKKGGLTDNDIAIVKGAQTVSLQALTLGGSTALTATVETAQTMIAGAGYVSDELKYGPEVISLMGSCPKSVIDDNHFRSNELWCGGLRAISPRGG